MSDLEGLELCEVCGLVESEHNDASPYKTHVFMLKPPVCRWTHRPDVNYRCWDSSCGGLPILPGGSLPEGYEFCPYCGKRIEEVS